MVDLFAVLLQPGAGDELQGIKKGDPRARGRAGREQGRRRAARGGGAHARRPRGTRSRCCSASPTGWTPRVLCASALTGDGHRGVLGARARAPRGAREERRARARGAACRRAPGSGACSTTVSRPRSEPTHVSLRAFPSSRPRSRRAGRRRRAPPASSSTCSRASARHGSSGSKPCAKPLRAGERKPQRGAQRSQSDGAAPIREASPKGVPHAAAQPRSPRDHAQDRVLRPRALGKDDESAADPRQARGRRARRDGHARHPGRPHAVLRLPAGRVRRRGRLQDQAEAVHGARPGAAPLARGAWCSRAPTRWCSSPTRSARRRRATPTRTATSRRTCARTASTSRRCRRWCSSTSATSRT